MVTLMQACGALMGKTVVRIRHVARVIGLLVAATSAVPLRKWHYRQLKIVKVNALHSDRGNFVATMIISVVMSSELT